ncbi:MAG: hypothetical protein JRF63_07810 [Deltaproteobacteria bacterium]|nr:hypothetical protein [Deltaproteobacteria bacterium]
MIKIVSRTARWSPTLLLLVVLLDPGAAQAQGAKTQALGLVRDGMDAYSNLDLDASRAKLNEALLLAPQLDKSTLSRVYVSIGVLEIGGYTDNAQGQRNFMIALCLDNTIMVDPLLSTPEIDIVFTMAKQQANPGQCQGLLASISAPGGGGPVLPPGGGGGPTLSQCGSHSPATAQKAKHELPLYMELAPQLRGAVSRIVVKYTLDGGTYNELPMNPLGAGFGAQITCDEGQIRIYDPASVSYYLEGFDRMGNLVCAHGSAQMPIVVAMDPMAPVLQGLPGMAPPKECVPCPPWDLTCGLPGLGDPCDPMKGCKDELVCGDGGICEEEGGGGGAAGGVQKFYVNIGGGVGFGYMKMDMAFDKIEPGDTTDDARIEHVVDTPSGFAFGGIPLRLWLGYFVIEDLAVEIGARFDVKIDSFSEPVSCWEGAGKSMTEVEGATCTGEPDSKSEAKKSVALTEGGDPVERTEKRIAWLANARARYQIVNNGAFRFSAFGGLGFGYIKYRVAAGDDPYFPMPYGLDIELGVGITYYFTDNFGLAVDIPIDIIVINGFALNFDVIVGLSFGF